MKNRPVVLSIGGFDPSGGAGVLADVKTFEQHKCQSLSVITANTIQTEDQFVAVQWIEKEIVLQQLNTLLQRYPVKWIKIGLLEDFSFIQEVAKHSKAKIIWDPVLSASDGFEFNQKLDEFTTTLAYVHCITPNWQECKALSRNSDAILGAKHLSETTNVYLKGGHNPSTQGKDYVFLKGNKESFSLNPKNNIAVTPKHGSGCVFSSALTANLALGFPLKKSCLLAKNYTQRFLASDKNLLGKHKF